MKPKPIDLRYRILCNMVLVASKNKVRTEEGLGNLLEILKLGVRSSYLSNTMTFYIKLYVFHVVQLSFVDFFLD